tara:strand:- start:14362 stop:15318 length:957 start_codon:yes stop_codon:yes gene_type:complete
MNITSENQPNTEYDDVIDIFEILFTLWDKKLFIVFLTSLFTLISILYALTVPNLYRSSALMMPTQMESGMGGMLSQYSSVASFAGVPLPSKTISKSQEAIARIRSFEFFSNHFMPYVALEDLLAVKKWDPVTNTLAYDGKIFDHKLNKWVRKAKFPRSIIPSYQEAYATYLDILVISEDKKTFFVSLSIEHLSPFLAQEWAELIINQIDLAMRIEDKNQALKSVEFLNTLTPSIKYEDIKKALFSLQQEQLKQLMLVEVNDNYIFRVLESPVAPEINSSPNRTIIVLMGTILGFMLSALIALTLHYKKKYQIENNQDC